MMLSILLACAPNLVAVPMPLALFQDDPSTETTQSPKTSDPYEMVIEYFHPERADVNTLQNMAQQLANTSSMQHKMWIGEENYVYMNPSFMTYGDSVLVRDSRQEIERTLEMLIELDANYTVRKRSSRTEVERQLFQYTVTHVGMESVRNALSSLYVQTTTQMGSGFVMPPQVSFVDEKNLVILRGTTDQVSEAESILQGLDVPKPRVMLTCYLISGTSREENDDRVPLDLAKDLGELVPYAGFKLMSSAFLPSDTQGTIELDVQLDDGSGEFELHMRPDAYDAKSGTLTMGSVIFKLSQVEEKRRMNKSFKTSTSLQRGSYTVLGAVGADPVFVVMKMSSGS